MKLTPEQIERLISLENDEGVLTADAVVADAKRDDSPLHGLFEWDVEKAAAKQWIDTARTIIRAVIYQQGDEAITRVQAPHYVHDASLPGQGYRSVVALKSDAAAARQTIREELNRALGAISRARSIAAILGLETEVAAMFDSLTMMKAKVDEEPELIAQAS